MSDNNNSSLDNNGESRPRRGSFTSNTFSAIFGRSNSISGNPTAVAPQPVPVNNAAGQQRRMSVSTLGLSGTSPIQTSPFGMRRTSVSTASSDMIDESAVEDDEGPSRSGPSSPFARRMSFGAQAILAARQGTGNQGTSTGRPPPNRASSPLLSFSGQEAGQRKPLKSTQASTQSNNRTRSDSVSNRSAEGLNWSEQFRTRAESAVSRPSFSTSPSSTINKLPNPVHNRTKSTGEMPTPPAAIQAPSPTPNQSALRRKPDAVGERILRGDFYMD